jgi:putative glutamine amidotransferase
MVPLIGVTTSELRRSHLLTLQGEPQQPEMALGMTYLRAVERAGGMPVVLPPLPPSAVDGLLGRLDGIVLSGGPDLDPTAYGDRERHIQLGPTEPGLDAFELALCRAADARRMPVLGVCRGAQTLNVARGGSLHQHIDGHRQLAPAEAPVHGVEIALHSRVARIMGAGSAAVNSFHHQAVDRLGGGLRVAARAADGTVEAVEDPARPLFLGVQWHAETLVDRPQHLALFRALVRAAAGAESRGLALAA